MAEGEPKFEDENLELSEKELETDEKVSESVREVINEIRSVRDLDLSSRLKTVLVKRRIETIGELIQRSGEELSDLKGITDDNVTQIREALIKLNLKLNDSEAEIEEDILTRKISKVDFEVELKQQSSIINDLGSEDINTIGDLIKKSAEELLEVRNFGNKKLQAIKKTLEKLGLKLRGD